MNAETVASMTEELNFTFYLVFINLNFNSYMWLIATVLESYPTLWERSDWLFLTRGSTPAPTICVEVGSTAQGWVTCVTL